jgi:hypothetical protein
VIRVVACHAQVSHLEHALKMKEEEMDRALSGLRLDHEKMRTALEAKLRSCPDPGRGGARVKELERQVMVSTRT